MSQSLLDYIGRLPGSASADAPLVRVGPREVEGRLGAAAVRSAFDPVRDRDGEIVGHLARTQAWAPEPVAATALFATIDGNDDLVRADRLVRTVHAINYFALPGQTTLFLDVDARLVATVPDRHGQTFQRVLDAIGVPTRRVAIVLPASLLDSPLLLAAVSAQYRLRHYRVAIEAPGGRPAMVAELIDRLRLFHPDFVRLRLTTDAMAGELHHLAHALAVAEVTLVAEGVDTPVRLQTVLGAECKVLMQGIAPGLSGAAPVSGERVSVIR